MTTRLDTLEAALRGALGDQVTRLGAGLGEITIEVKGADVKAVAQTLRDHPDLAFSELIDLCGVDYSDYGNGTWDGPRFAVVYHLLSIPRNWRVRLRAFCADDDFPSVDSWSTSGRPPTGTSARRSTSSGSCSPDIPICAAS